MKKLILLSCILLSCINVAKAKERVIECPPFAAWNSNSIEVAKITINDTATVVDIKAYYTPKQWIKIGSGSILKDEKGVSYPIRRGIGITLDKEFWMPESGEAEFKLVFPTLPESVSTVDFSEGDFNGAFKIWGIELNKKNSFTLPKEVVVPKIDSKATLTEPVFTYGKAVLSGKILNYRKELIQQGALYIESPISSNSSIEIPIKEDGTFRVEVDVLTHTVASLYMGALCYANVYLAPGKETLLTINTRECTRQTSKLHMNDKPYGEQIYFGGYLASLQQELQRNNIKIQLADKFATFANEMKGKSLEEVTQQITSKYQEIIERINKTSLSPAAKEVLTITAQLKAADMLLSPEIVMKQIHIIANNLSQAQARSYFQDSIINVPESYYAVLKNYPVLTSSKILYSMGGIRNFMRNTDKLAKIFNTNKGVIFDASTAQNICGSIAEFTPLNDEQKQQVSALPASYKEMIQAMNDELLTKIEINKKKTGFTINEVGQVSNEDLFSSIISKYKGRVLLVDFWATWCGPCRMANKEMIPMKEELKDKDIVYIYITGETSPKGTWENMIPDIHGEHYRVTADQWKFLLNSFNIEGVPTYLVIDRDGNTSFKQVGFPGVSKMKEELMKAVNK